MYEMTRPNNRFTDNFRFSVFEKFNGITDWNGKLFKISRKFDEPVSNRFWIEKNIIFWTQSITGTVIRVFRCDNFLVCQIFDKGLSQNFYKNNFKNSLFLVKTKKNAYPKKFPNFISFPIKFKIVSLVAIWPCKNQLEVTLYRQKMTFCIFF